MRIFPISMFYGPALAPADLLESLYFVPPLPIKSPPRMTLMVLKLAGIFLLLMGSGCSRVVTEHYIHSSTDKIRTGQYNSAYLADASNAFPAVLDGFIIVPEFYRVAASTANLSGSLFVVARSDQSIIIKTVTMHSPDLNETHTLSPDAEIDLNYYQQTNLWNDKINLKLPAGLFVDAQTIDVSITWLDKRTNKQDQAVFKLNCERQARYVFPT